ncbi:MAG: hypothetical protein KatS3mg034_1182 [Vicingaceae bacterium]|nr:MAG: hypothetical protein KatS3mg034_1182 [Vicingaceae bacterium]
MPIKDKKFLIGILALLIIIVLLFVLRQKPQSNSRAAVQAGEQSPAYSLESMVEKAKAEMSENNRHLVELLEFDLDTMKNTRQQAIWYDSLAIIWKRFQWPTVSALYLKKAAEKDPGVERWFKAGDAFFEAFQYSNQFQLENIENARYCYEQVLKLDPGNLDAKSGVAVCVIEGAKFTGTPPMEGIRMLTAILAEDSTHVKTLVNLGYYAMQSGQYEKALERFKAALRSDTTQTDLYIYIADACLALKDTVGAIASLKGFVERTDNPDLKYQTEQFIMKLEKNK